MQCNKDKKKGRAMKNEALKQFGYQVIIIYISFHCERLDAIANQLVKVILTNLPNFKLLILKCIIDPFFQKLWNCFLFFYINSLLLLWATPIAPAFYAICATAWKLLLPCVMNLHGDQLYPSFNVCTSKRVWSLLNTHDYVLLAVVTILRMCPDQLKSLGR